MNWKRIGRALVCLLVVCCLLLNMVSVRAEAFAVETVAIGVAAVLILLAAGVVFLPQTVDDVVAIGNSMQTYMYQWGEETDQLTEVEDWFVGIVFEDGGDSDGDGDPDTPHQRQLTIARGLLGGIAAWVASVIVSGIVDPNSEALDYADSIPAGYALFNGWCLPWSDSFNSGYSVIMDRGNNFYTGVTTEEPLKVYRLNYGAGYRYGFYECGSVLVYTYSTDSDATTWTINEYAEGEFLSYFGAGVIWANYSFDASAYSLDAVEASEAILSPYYDYSLVSDAASGIRDGTASETDIYVPTEIDYSSLLSSTETMVNDVISTSSDLYTGTITYNYYLEVIQPDTNTDEGTDTETEPTETQPAVIDPGTEDGSGDSSETEPTTGVFLPDSLGNTNAGTFLDTLVDAITAPFEGLAETLLEGIKAIFVPSEDFLTAKVETLRAEFSFADSIISAGELVGTTLQSLETEPPVIYIDLGASRGSYYLGGKEIFIDLRWYAEYKPTVDALLSALLWIAFIWRLFVKLPGIISGMPGDFVMDGLQQIGLSDRLPARNAAYEVQRINNRQTLRKRAGK